MGILWRCVLRPHLSKSAHGKAFHRFGRGKPERLAEPWSARALRTYGAIQHQYYDSTVQLYRHPFQAGAYDHLWPFANVWMATCALSRIGGLDPSDLRARLSALSRYSPSSSTTPHSEGPLGFQSAPSPPLGPGGDTYYDDNSWILLALLDQHSITGDTLCVGTAKRIFEFLLSGWSRGESWSYAGGIRWAEPAWSLTRNTCSNAPTAAGAAWLYLLTKDPQYLEWATRIYDWTRTTLLTKEYLYADSVAPGGSVDPAVWSYNQGSMIGAGVRLFHATREERYLEEAISTAQTCCEYFEAPDRLSRQGAAFNAIYFSNLLALKDYSPELVAKHFEQARNYCIAMSDLEYDKPDGVSSGGINLTAPMVTLYAALAGSGK